MPPEKAARRFEPFVLAAILLVAALLRFHALDTLPPGLTHDEADVGFYAAAVARGEPAHYDVPYGYAYEPFGQYSAGLLMRVLGANDYALRAHQTLYGLLVVGLIYAWARLAFGWSVAAGASMLAALLFWTVFTSRMALNSQAVPALFLLAVLALWQALYEARPHHRWWVVFALSVAAVLHVYEAARVVWFALPVFALYLAFTDRARLRRHGRAFALALGAGTALALPHLLDPGAWGRTEALGGALTALRSGNPRPLAISMVEGLGTLGVSGDTLVTYNIPGRPVLGLVMAVFFCIGLLYCLVQVKRPAYAFSLIWLAFGLAPTLVIGAYTSTLHSIAAQPVVCIIPALGAAWLMQHRRKLFATVWLAALVLSGVRTAHDYFSVWGEDIETRAVYFHTLAAITARVDADFDGVVLLSSPFPTPPLDPFIGQMRVSNPRVDLRWMDARHAVILPRVDTAHLIASADAPLDPYLAALLQPVPVERVVLRPDDRNPHYDIYRIDLNTARHRLAERLPLPSAGSAVFGDAVALRGCTVAWQDGMLTVTTLWELLDPGALGRPPVTQYAHELAIFVHAFGADGRNVGQADALGAPASEWRAGDVFVHLHRIAPVDKDVTLRLGIYNRVDGRRLPLAIDGAAAGDALAPDCVWAAP